LERSSVLNRLTNIVFDVMLMFVTMCTQKNGLYLLTAADDILQHFHLLQSLTVTHSHCR